MMKLFNRYWHWVLLAVLGLNLVVGFMTFESTRLSLVALVFGGIGFLAFFVLSVLVEKKRKKSE
ncbi:hypothetical protein E3U55_10450 [Filobacillus milosensis]|uniref:Uncharacterized protein n=1 Tax=Filobacillus milosensis TaxID=94137 RepID=A0A4Y8IFY5_9BACI|nr:hypothetical protein [Filobacillus milosensis]TFB19573.1 hypothetical protein E3U55_10450 [Filobacillus milosensis]